MAARKTKSPPNEWEEMQKVIDQQGKAIAKLEETVNLLMRTMCLESRRKALLAQLDEQKNKKG